MTSHHFALLKKLVISMANLPNFTSADCKTLSLLIYQKTKQSLSETTLKRVYGFAYSKFNSSLFTLDTLAQYCNYPNWSTFLVEYESDNGADKNICWLNLGTEAGKVTKYSTRILINRTGIGYKSTIKRHFVDSHLNSFLTSGCIATVICAPAGYGKTIALLHWIEDKRAENNLNDEEDIFLLFSAHSLLSVLSSGQDIFSWMLSMLGYSRNDISAMLLDNKTQKPGKFYFIIDGLDEPFLKSDQFNLLCSQLYDVLQLYQLSDSFRFIVTMRSSTWVNNKHRLGDDQIWYTGFMDIKTNNNVPLFNLKEIYELSEKLNPQEKINIDESVMDLLSNPLAFELFYKINAGNFSFKNLGRLTKYEIVSAFILEKIYLDKYGTEKMLFLFELIDLMDVSSGCYCLNKLKAAELLIKYNTVYNDLISIEFLKECNKSSDLQPYTYIAFGNPDFLEYTVAQKLLAGNENRLNSELIRTTDDLLPNDCKISVVKWFLIYAIKTQQQYALGNLFELKLPANKKAELIAFIGELLEKGYLALTPAIATSQYFNFSLRNEDFDYLFGFEYTDVAYEKTLHTFLKFELNNDKKIMILCSLAMISIIKLDLAALEDNLTDLRKIDEHDFFKYPINPLTCLNTIYYYLKYGIIKKEALIEITKFCFNLPEDENSFKKSAANDLIYLIANRTLQITRNPRKQIRFVRILNQHYQLSAGMTFEYSFFLKMVIAEAYFIAGDKKNLLLTYRNILKSNVSPDQYTPYMSALFYALKIKIVLIEQNYQAIEPEYKHFASITDKHCFKLMKFYLGALILKQGNTNNEFMNSQFYKKLQYEHTKLMLEVKVVAFFDKQENYRVISDFN